MVVKWRFVYKNKYPRWKKYKLKGLDIYTDLKITPWEAALGTRISVDSIDETLSLCIPQGTESGEK